MGTKYNWTRQETKDLITLYEINECLWNKNLREYKDRDERISSIQSIADEMKVSIEEINKKIHNLRNQYRFELNKTKKVVPGKPKYTTKWPYFQNLSFLETIVSVRGSNAHQNNNNNSDFADNSEYTLEKYDDENSSEKTNNINNNTETAILSTGGSSNQPQQIFTVSVEYEEPKPKIKSEQIDGSRKRRIFKEKTVEVAPQQLLNQFVGQLQPVSSTPKLTPNIVIDDKSQDQETMRSTDIDEPASKTPRLDDGKKDKFDIFGMFVASEMRNLNSQAQRKLKKKILECVMEINDQDDKIV